MLLYNELSDLELASLLKDDDQAAYTELFSRYNGLLYVYAVKVTRDRDEAEDIVQEVFYYLWNKRKELRLTSTFASYLYSAVRYKFFNLLDAKKVRADYAGSLANFISSGQIETDHLVRERELARLIEAEIDKLPEKMREIFILSRREHLSNKEIAQKLGIKEKTVKNQINSALKHLRPRLGLALFIVMLSGLN